MTMTDYMNKAYAYLKSKLPDVPEYTIAEIAAHLTNVAAIALLEEVDKVQEVWMAEIKRRERMKYPATRSRNDSGRDVRRCLNCEHHYWHDPECSDCNEKNGFKYYTARNDGGAKT